MHVIDLDARVGVQPNTPSAMQERAAIMRIQRACQGLPNDHRMDESPPLKHWTAPGIYAREIHLPADSVVVGKVHRFRHLSILSAGRVTVMTEFGVEELTAPASFISEPGTKRVVHTHEAAIWTTIHPNPENVTDTAALERMFVVDEYAELGMKVADLEELT